MASDESMMMSFESCDLDDDDEEDKNSVSDHHDHHKHEHLQHPHHNLSRLSVCTSSSVSVEQDDNDETEMNEIAMCVSRLSIETGEDADAEQGLLLNSSDSENSEGSCYSLPATRRRQRHKQQEYASDNEAQKGKRRRRRRKRRSVMESDQYHHDEIGGGGVVLITRPKGGNRTLWMGLEEVKACRDLGFELEHHTMLSPTTTPPNSPFSNWRISSPGDDPRDVKARLKVWAQAVAIASASSHQYST